MRFLRNLPIIVLFFKGFRCSADGDINIILDPKIFILPQNMSTSANLGTQNALEDSVKDDNEVNDNSDDEANEDDDMEDICNVGGGDRIVGGIEVDISMYPYHVSYGDVCGGVIIDALWVMTAAHCGSRPYVRIGSKYLYGGTTIPIQNYYVNPQWRGYHKEHEYDWDFQLLKLKQPLPFGPNVNMIKLGRKEDLQIGTTVTVTGWGHTTEGGKPSNVLRAVRVPVIGKDKCRQVKFPSYSTLTARMFCAGPEEGGKDACQGDSGGPAAANGKLLGLVSFGYGCARKGAYGVYSNVVASRPWVKEVTRLPLP